MLYSNIRQHSISQNYSYYDVSAFDFIKIPDEMKRTKRSGNVYWPVGYTNIILLIYDIEIHLLIMF